MGLGLCVCVTPPFLKVNYLWRWEKLRPLDTAHLLCRTTTLKTEQLGTQGQHPPMRRPCLEAEEAILPSIRKVQWQRQAGACRVCR